jgi:3-hydroxyisobutyrate dehydrogenase
METFSRNSCAFAGLGAMGMPIAAAFSEVWEKLIVVDIDSDKAERFCATSRAVAGDVADLAAADVIFLCLPTHDAVDSVLREVFNQDDHRVRTIIDFGAHGPKFVAEIAACCARYIATYCDAPVFGTPSMASDGNLYFLFSGPESLYDAFRADADAAGYRSRHAGAVGAASAVKLLQNALGAINLLAGAEALRICEKAGIGTGLFADVVAECGGIGRSSVFDRFAHVMAQRADIGEGRMRIAAKDMAAATELSHQLGCPAGLLSEATDRYQQAIEAGMGDEQFSNIIKIL